MARTWIMPVHIFQVNEMLGDGSTGTDINVNEEIRDRMTMLSDHVHSGAVGEGSANLTLSSTQFTDVSTPSAPASGKTIIWTGSGRLSQRTNGGAAEIIQEAHSAHTSATS
tara:strand:- start:617 stop:949 length:333 start_codon:yes stop_codon:yes gene_type:complete